MPPFRSILRSFPPSFQTHLSSVSLDIIIVGPNSFPIPTLKKCENVISDHNYKILKSLILRGAMGEFSNFYNFPPRMLMFGTHMPPAVTMHAAKFH